MEKLLQNIVKKFIKQIDFGKVSLKLVEEGDAASVDPSTLDGSEYHVYKIKYGVLPIGSITTVTNRRSAKYLANIDINAAFRSRGIGSYVMKKWFSGYYIMADNSRAAKLYARIGKKYNNFTHKEFEEFVQLAGMQGVYKLDHGIVWKDGGGVRLFHVSENPNLTTMIPRIPNNRLVRKGYENGTIGRICFARTIKDCIAAAPRGKLGQILYVYKPVNVDKKYVYIPKPSEVPDAKYTHEVWYLKPVNVKRIATIVVGDESLMQRVVGEGSYDRHFILRYHNFKKFKNDPTKEEAEEYLKTQPGYLKQIKQQKQSEKIRNIIKKASIAAAGGALFALIGNKLVNLSKKNIGE